jgi:hypothetical protein
LLLLFIRYFLLQLCNAIPSCLQLFLHPAEREEETNLTPHPLLTF